MDEKAKKIIEGADPTEVLGTQTESVSRDMEQAILSVIDEQANTAKQRFDWYKNAIDTMEALGFSVADQLRDEGHEDLAEQVLEIRSELDSVLTGRR